jgi:hypothetical protein
MSFSNPTPQNPAQHFFEWRNGQISFYDKEKKENIKIPLPFEFIVLDQLHTITGYSDEDESGFWSNELKSLSGSFNVRTKKGTQYYGPYKNAAGIKQVPTGAKYTKSIYIAHTNKAGELILGNLKLTGAALTAWIDTLKGVDFTKSKIAITGSTEGKKGATTYAIPTFETTTDIASNEFEVATLLDEQLQAYLYKYLNSKEEPEVHEEEDYTPTEEDKLATQEQVTAFEAKRDNASKFRANKEAAKTFDVDIDDKPIDLSEIPF